MCKNFEKKQLCWNCDEIQKDLFTAVTSLLNCVGSTSMNLSIPWKKLNNQINFFLILRLHKEPSSDKSYCKRFLIWFCKKFINRQPNIHKLDKFYVEMSSKKLFTYINNKRSNIKRSMNNKDEFETIVKIMNKKSSREENKKLKISQNIVC